MMDDDKAFKLLDALLILLGIVSLIKIFAVMMQATQSYLVAGIVTAASLVFFVLIWWITRIMR